MIEAEGRARLSHSTIELAETPAGWVGRVEHDTGRVEYVPVAGETLAALGAVMEGWTNAE